ncbi:glutathione-disulfide reductase [Sulfuritalea sp.]|uniref:glutathione-disulfide reductase n=1 Tax=Sulfuritalea sp. TaxID=2480090 RepID=UPI00286D78D7|nr:glutathione-disulfide reductase [Sulfuritalea sp.]
MSDFEFDFFVIGGGSGGVRAARVAAGLGARVAIVESSRYGGTCVIRGCVPKKLLVQAAHYAEDFADAAGFGWTVPPTAFSWPHLVAAKETEISRLSRIYQDLLGRSGVTVLQGAARFIDPHTLDVDGRRIRARQILIATGGKPKRPAVPGIEHAITSDEAFDLPVFPQRVLIVGGGYIAVEFAGIFNGLGAEVTLSYRGEQILRGFDDDVRRHLQEEMGKKDISILLGSTVARLDRQADARLLASFTGASEGALPFDAVMYATGRAPNLGSLDPAAAGVELAPGGGIRVDAWSRTSVSHIYAVGDVTDGIALTPVAIRQGAAVANNLFGPTPLAADLALVPSAVFSQPPIGTVGLSEAAALEQFAEVDIYQSSFRPLRHALSGRDERTLIKLVVASESQRILGAHMVGPDAPEIIQGLAVALRMGATKADFDATLGIHPTSAEEFMTLRDRQTRRRHAQ